MWSKTKIHNQLIIIISTSSCQYYYCSQQNCQASVIEHVEPNKTVGGEWRLSSARFPTLSAVSKVVMHLKFKILLFQDIVLLCSVYRFKYSNINISSDHLQTTPKQSKIFLCLIYLIFLRPANSRTSWENMRGK